MSNSASDPISSALLSPTGTVQHSIDGNTNDIVGGIGSDQVGGNKGAQRYVATTSLSSNRRLLAHLQRLRSRTYRSPTTTAPTPSSTSSPSSSSYPFVARQQSSPPSTGAKEHFHSSASADAEASISATEVSEVVKEYKHLENLLSKQKASNDVITSAMTKVCGAHTKALQASVWCINTMLSTMPTLVESMKGELQGASDALSAAFAVEKEVEGTLRRCSIAIFGEWQMPRNLKVLGADVAPSSFPTPKAYTETTSPSISSASFSFDRHGGRASNSTEPHQLRRQLDLERTKVKEKSIIVERLQATIDELQDEVQSLRAKLSAITPNPSFNGGSPSSTPTTASKIDSSVHYRTRRSDDNGPEVLSDIKAHQGWRTAAGRVHLHRSGSISVGAGIGRASVRRGSMATHRPSDGEGDGAADAVAAAAAVSTDACQLMDSADGVVTPNVRVGRDGTVVVSPVRDRELMGSGDDYLRRRIEELQNLLTSERTRATTALRGQTNALRERDQAIEETTRSIRETEALRERLRTAEMECRSVKDDSVTSRRERESLMRRQAAINKELDAVLKERDEAIRERKEVGFCACCYPLFLEVLCVPLSFTQSICSLIWLIIIRSLTHFDSLSLAQFIHSLIHSHDSLPLTHLTHWHSIYMPTKLHSSLHFQTKQGMIEQRRAIVDLESAQRVAEELQSSVEEALEKIHTLENSHLSLEQDKEILREQLSETSGRLDSMRKERVMCSEERDTALRERDTALARLREMESNINIQSHAKFAAESRLADVERQCVALREQLKMAKRERERIEEEKKAALEGQQKANAAADDAARRRMKVSE